MSCCPSIRRECGANNSARRILRPIPAYSVSVGEMPNRRRLEVPKDEMECWREKIRLESGASHMLISYLRPLERLPRIPMATINPTRLIESWNSASAYGSIRPHAGASITVHDRHKLQARQASSSQPLTNGECDMQPWRGHWRNCFAHRSLSGMCGVFA